MAAAGLYILDNNMLRLKNDHKKAKEIGKTLSRLSIVKIVESIETNIIQLEDDVDEQYFVKWLASKNIYIVSMVDKKLRMVTHLDYTVT